MCATRRAPAEHRPTTFAGLKRRLHPLAFIDEFGPVSAVCTLWFNDHGISTSQVSTVFVVWAGALALAGLFVVRWSPRPAEMEP